MYAKAALRKNHEKTGCSSELGGQILGYAVCEISLFLVVVRWRFSANKAASDGQ
jgi:hypothetical protein